LQTDFTVGNEMIHSLWGIDTGRDTSSHNDTPYPLVPPHGINSPKQDKR